ncbi:hypothetical protein DdX_08656 [Ditylenchus destructor]|uniref:Uncharacterized protein n=1 Tax=Ditylenchus destructor TaxID=166010 RepID=A0AAD4N4J1_9BILA|nr:hypothetical protein DdX_08656 [Ditylenchus destructor]
MSATPPPLTLFMTTECIPKALPDNSIVAFIWVGGNLIVALGIVVGVIIWYQFLPQDNARKEGEIYKTAVSCDTLVTPESCSTAPSSD